MRRRKPRRAGPAHFGGEGRGGSNPPAPPLASKKLDTAQGTALRAIVEEAASELCRGRQRAPRDCPDLPGYSHTLWCLPCKAREALDRVNGDVCDHNWVDARNEAVESGELCTLCHAVRPGNIEPPPTLADLPLTKSQIIEPRRLCPDGGTCHHECEAKRCFRVRQCGPLSAYGEDWTEADKAEFGQPPAKPSVEDVLVGDGGLGDWEDAEKAEMSDQVNGPDS